MKKRKLIPILGGVMIAEILFLANKLTVTAPGLEILRTALNIPGKPAVYGSLEYMRQFVDELDAVQIIGCSELTGDILAARDGKIIVEEIIGIATSDKDGRIINCKNPDYNYISYENVDGAKPGDIVVTYCIYNPDTSYEDDIILRRDYIVGNLHKESSDVR